MGVVLTLCAFAIAYAVASDAGNSALVYGAGAWDPKFGSPQGSVAVFRQLLLYFVAVATLSCFVGVARHAVWLNGHMRSAFVIGGVSGVMAAALFCAYGAAAQYVDGGTGPVSILGGLLLFVAGPAFIAYAAVLKQRRIPPDPTSGRWVSRSRP